MSEPDPSAQGSAAVELLGADRGALSTDPPAWNGMFLMPLAVGNRWDYTVRARTRLIVPGSPDVIEEEESPWISVILSRQPINSQEYYLFAEYDPRSLGLVVAQSALRQNRSGLYSTVPPVPGPLTASHARSNGLDDTRFAPVLAAAAAKSRHPEAFAAAGERLAARLSLMSTAGGAQGLPDFPSIPGMPARGGDDGIVRRGDHLPGEISLIVYPMYVGSRWVVRDSPRFTRVVEGRGRTTVPAGEFATWTQRGNSELFSPDEVVRFYYAREGLIRVTLHAEVNVVGNADTVVGRFILDMEQALTSFTSAESAN